MFLRRKLKACRHKNTNVYNYVRDSGLIDELVGCDDFDTRRRIKGNMTGMRFCLDCGATQRFLLCDPLGLNDPNEPWIAPWLWR